MKFLMVFFLLLAGCSTSCYHRMTDTSPGAEILIYENPVVQNLVDYNIAIMDGQEVRCSGIVILLEGSLHIVTAAHCVYSELDELSETIMFRFGKTAGIAKHEVDSREKDLALYSVHEVPTNSVLCPADIAEDDPDVGQVVFVVGNPGGEEDMVSHGLVSKVDDDIYIDGNVWFGNSGGGVFTKDMKLLGITQRLMQPGNYGLASTNSELRSFLGI